jgi:hypothetical protein
LNIPQFTHVFPLKCSAFPTAILLPNIIIIYKILPDYLFRLIAIFYLGYLTFLLLSCRTYLSDLQILYHSVVCPFTLLIISFDAYKFSSICLFLLFLSVLWYPTQEFIANVMKLYSDIFFYKGYSLFLSL